MLELPVILIVVLIPALAAVLFIMKFMVPMFVEIFKRTNNELSSLTKMIITISNNLIYYLVLFFFIILGFLVIDTIVKKSKDYRLHKGYLMLKIPLVGPLLNFFIRQDFFSPCRL
ncbi:MAG TPA: hypothetical protein DEH40_09195 [Marinilabiliales bacterium]|nr:hypothetical protein [Marinilabiliales bacterium]